MEDHACLTPNPIMPNECVDINPELCIGCNSCVDVCRSDLLVPSHEKGKPPYVMYPDECWFCGCCAEHCPVEGAITMVFPMNQRVGWKRKETGEYFRLGMKNPPPPSKKSPVG